MRTIVKGREPRTLTEHRASAEKPYTRSDFDNYRDKAGLRQALLHEQGHICCYCMSRISAETMKIEHWKPVGEPPRPNLTLTYSNLLGACMGGEGESKEQQHCDTHKGSDTLTINPVNRGQCERLIRYTPTGVILSDDAQINHDLNNTLNLNLGWLKTNRQQLFKVVLDGLIRTKPAGSWSRELIMREIQKWDSRNADGKLSPYCEVAIYALKKRLPKN